MASRIVKRVLLSVLLLAPACMPRVTTKPFVSSFVGCYEFTDSLRSALWPVGFFHGPVLLDTTLDRGATRLTGGEHLAATYDSAYVPDALNVPTWILFAPDSLEVRMGGPFSGEVMRLHRADSLFEGLHWYWDDVVDTAHPSVKRPVFAARVACPRDRSPLTYREPAS